MHLQCLQKIGHTNSKGEQETLDKQEVCMLK